MQPIRRLVAIVALAAVIAACTEDSGSDPADTDVTLPEADVVLTVASVPWPECLDPVLCDDPAAADLVWEHVLPKLMEVGPSGAYRPSPVLDGAPTIAIDDVGRTTITYRLDEGARWHDGRPITSSDVLGTWVTLQATAGARSAGYDHIVGIDDRDPRVAVVTLDRPWSDWAELFGGFDGWLLQADALGDLDLQGRIDAALPFGAGPYRLAAMDDDRILLSAAETFWAPDRAPVADLVEIRRTARADAERGLWPMDADVLVPGGVDAGVPAGYRREAVPAAEVVALAFDTEGAVTGNLALRQAVDDRFDRGALNALTVTRSEEIPALVACTGWLPDQPACTLAAAQEARADLEAASARLVSGGWARTASGVRRLGRTDAEFRVGLADDIANLEALGTALEIGMGQVGVTVSVGGDASNWLAGTQEGRPDAAVVAVPVGTAGRLGALFGCELTPGPFRWCDGGVQDWLAELYTATDTDRRDELGARIAQRAASQAVFLPLYRRDDVGLVATDVVVGDDRRLDGGPLAGLFAIDPSGE